jgi:hypothetical protein
MDTKPIVCDGRVIGSIVVALLEEGADGDSFQSAALEEAPGALTTPSWRRGGDHAPGQGVSHHNHGSNAPAPHRRTLGGPKRHSETGRHLDPHNREREADSSRPQHFSVGDVKQAVAPTGINRERFRQELRDKPWLREKVLHVSAGENEGREANQAVIESAMNRAQMMGTTLEQEMRRTSEGGYYAGYRANVAEPQRRMIEENIDKALAGSNVSNYATDNSSQGFHTSGPNSMYRTVKSSNGENFSVPARSDARGHDRYDAWRREAEAGSPAGGKPVGVTALPPQKGEPTFANMPLNVADLAYLTQHGGHSTTGGRAAAVGQSMGFDPTLAARLHAAGNAYTAETGKKPIFGEGDRDAATQQRYWEDSGHGSRYPAAPPGRSKHQDGKAMDLPDSEFRKWLKDGNMNRFGLYFPVRGDAPHVQADPNFEGHKEANK